MNLTRFARWSRIPIRILPIVCLLAAGPGCIFDPDKGGPPPPPPFQYPPLNSPENALLNLKYAWERKDSVRTRETYDEGYLGEAPNPQGPPFTFSKKQEVAVVWAIGQDPDVTAPPVMELKPQNTWIRTRFASDPPGWATIQLIRGVVLEVSTVETTWRAATSEIQYKFKPYPPGDPLNVTGQDTTWLVVRWSETL